MSMIRHQLILACAVATLVASPLLEAAAPRPNIVLIFVDDLGYGDLACYGNPRIKTPHIDQLAAEGQRWTSFYASGAVCVPSRTGLMSGRHPALFGGKNRLPTTRDQLMPAMLKRQGYTTAILGKWHLAGYPKDFTRSPMHPLECGFDFHYGTPGSNDVPAPVGKRQTRAVFDACEKFTFQIPLIRGRKVEELPANQELFTKRYTAEAVKWIQANKERPFFLYLAHNMPHAPIFSSQAFQGKSAGGRFGDVIEEIDWSVGQVMKTIKEAGIDDNTLVIFTSDNGPWSMFEVHAGTAHPLRGEKGTSWEGGYRVPAIFRWPGHIKPGTRNDMAANLDLYATFATLTGGSQPTKLSAYMSSDLSPSLLQGKPSPRTQWFYSMAGAIAFRSGNYKIHLSTRDRSSDPDTRAREPATTHQQPLLFDLSRDVGEQTNLGDKHPEVVTRLQREMAAFRKQP